MNKIYFLFLILTSCVLKQTSETVADDSVKQEVLLSIVNKDTIEIDTLTEKSEIVLKTVPITNNKWLEELANNPFSKELDAMKAMWDSLGITSSYENGENGALTSDSVEIAFNKSYGESICVADVRSRRLTLNKGIAIGMPLTDFLNLTGIKTSLEEDLRYEYTHSHQEHTYTIRFDFIDKELIRFHYEKDPCVIYD